MLPGKTYTPEDLIHILRQRYWMLLVPFAVVAALTAVVARLLPDVYQSHATIVAVAQQVPETFVKSTVSTKMSDRLPSIAQRILSRAKLESIIEEHNLYAKERKTDLMEDIIDEMKKDIVIQPLKADAFTVSYQSSSAQSALKVTERLAALFKDENLLDRESTAEHTSQFLEAQLVEAKTRLREQETKLQAYREQYAGQLPSQIQSNLATLQNSWQNIQQTNDSIGQLKDRRLILDRQVQDLTVEKSPDAATPPEVALGDVSGAVSVQRGTTNQQLAAYKSLLVSYEQRGLTAGHPDVVKVKRLIAGLEEKADAEALQTPVSLGASGAGVPRATPAEVERRTKVAAYRAEMEQLDKQIASKEAEVTRLQADAAALKTRVDNLPARESDLTELTRDYQTYQDVYTVLLRKKEDAKISASLESQEIGQQFKLIDPPRLAEKPTSPNRRVINILGMLAGLGLGLLTIALTEYRDSTFKTDDEVTRLLGLPVLAVVPMMQSDEDVRRAIKRRRFVGAGLGSTVAACLAIVIYTFVR